MQKEIDEFLRRHQMHYEQIDWDKETHSFARQMEAGLEGHDSSLMMIPSFVMMGNNIPCGKSVIVVDAGGTNLRVAVAEMNQNGEVSLSNYRKYPMPGTQGTLTAEAFFDQLADRLEPVVMESDEIGICFSFPCTIFPNCDGQILGFSKEVRVTGAQGLMLGESLNQTLVRRGHTPKSVTVLNDTVATMMGGLASAKGANFDNYVGFILGTGTNTCYVERTEKITKSLEACAAQGKMAINMESCGYNGFVQGTFDRMVDQLSDNPGSHQMEKMISGAYLGKVLLQTVQTAAAEGLFSAGFSQTVQQMTAFVPQDIDAFVLQPEGEGLFARMTQGCAEDRIHLYELIDAYYERAARITVINLAGIASCTKIPRGGSFCVMAEGSVFEKSALYAPKLKKNIETYLHNKMGVSCSIMSGNDTTLVGTAVAALMQRK